MENTAEPAGLRGKAATQPEEEQENEHNTRQEHD